MTKNNKLNEYRIRVYRNLVWVTTKMLISNKNWKNLSENNTKISADLPKWLPNILDIKQKIKSLNNV